MVLWDDLVEWGGAGCGGNPRERGHMYIHIKQLYSPLPKKKKDFPLDLKEQRCDREALTVTLPGGELDLDEN